MIRKSERAPAVIQDARIMIAKLKEMDLASAEAETDQDRSRKQFHAKYLAEQMGAESLEQASDWVRGQLGRDYTKRPRK